MPSSLAAISLSPFKSVDFFNVKVPCPASSSAPAR